MKRVLCLVSLVLLLCCCFYVDDDYVEYLSFNNLSFISVSLTSFDSRDINNLVDKSLSYVLMSLFVESIYREYVEGDLLSFRLVSKILSKPFVLFWIIDDLFNFVVNKVDYIIQQIRKYFVYFVKLLFLSLLLLSFLLYIKTHLKTYRSAPIVLRC